MDKKNMTVADMIAACRKMDGQGGGGSSPAAEKPAEKPAPAKPAAEAKPVAAKPAPAAGGARPSVQEMMAAARAQKPGAAPAAESKPAPTAAKESPKPAPKAAPKPAAPAPPSGPKDTGSILAAAAANKPGPTSKAEAAAKPAAKEAAPRRPVPPMPIKPDYAKPKLEKKPQEESRRVWMLSVLFGSSLAIGYTALSTTFGLWTLGFARFMFPNILTEPPSKFKVGFPGNFSPGQVETKFVAQFGVWIVNWEYNGLSQIYALRTVCTHLGCTPNWLEAEQKFKCPCHGSGFYKDGVNFEGPAPRPLERYAIHLADDGQLEVDKSKLFLEEQGQWKDANSYYLV
jgi:cytochrome b6-f complex iron-sulfur subunit